MKYLEMLQAIIARMASNQFSLRTWSVGLGTAIIGYAAAKDNWLGAALLAVLPAVVFWLMDGYYLALERKFRNLFDTERQVNDDTPSFSLKVAVGLGDVLTAAIRPAVWLVHMPVLVLALFIGAPAWIR